MISDCMNKREKYPDPHPLKEEFRKRKIPLWYLRNHTGISEPKLSRYLNNIDPMPFHLQSELYQLIKITVDEKEIKKGVSTEPDSMFGKDDKK